MSHRGENSPYLYIDIIKPNLKLNRRNVESIFMYPGVAQAFH